MTQFTRKVDGYDGDWVRADDINELQEAIEQQSFNVMRYGATGDGVTDDTAAIQAAIDAAQSAMVADGFNAAPIVFIPPGRYRISDTIDVKSAPLMSPGRGALSAQIYWDGSADDAAFRKVDTQLGGSFGGMFGLKLRYGTAEPDVWIDLTFAGESSVLDVFFQLEHVQFLRGKRCIDIGQWVNVHWSHLRFDSWQEYAITLTPPASQSFSSFVLDQFTADNQSATAASKGFIKLTHPESGNAVGVIHLSNARIELNTAQRDPNCILHRVNPDNSANISAGLMMTNCQVICHTALDGVIYHESTGNVWGTRAILNGCAVFPTAPVNASTGFTSPYETVNTDTHLSLVTDGAMQVRLGVNDVELNGPLNHDGTTAGFYGTTPATKPTGVAVSAEGIHAALVTLGLIGA